MYYIKYHTGAGDDIAETFDLALKTADEGAAYTQQNIDILDEEEKVVATRQWCGVAYADDESAENPIEFGNFGFYDDWVIY